MENQFSPPPTDRLSTSGVQRPREPTSPAQADPGRSAWISGLARRVYGAYRKDDFADPDSFLAQLGMVLERYPDEIIRHITSPVTGIQRRSKFPPTIAEVAEACDEEVARVERIQRLGALRTAPREPRVTQHRANVFVPTYAPQYHEMVERAKTGAPQEWRLDPDRSGIWVALGWLRAPRDLEGEA